MKTCNGDRKNVNLNPYLTSYPEIYHQVLEPEPQRKAGWHRISELMQGRECFYIRDCIGIVCWNLKLDLQSAALSPKNPNPGSNFQASKSAFMSVHLSTDTN